MVRWDAATLWTNHTNDIFIAYNWRTRLFTGQCGLSFPWLLGLFARPLGSLDTWGWIVQQQLQKECNDGRALLGWATWHHTLRPLSHKPGVPIRPLVSYSDTPLYNLNKYIANSLKAYVRDENNNAKNSTTFSNYIRNVPIEDDEIMVSFDITSLYMNIAILIH